MRKNFKYFFVLGLLGMVGILWWQVLLAEDGQLKFYVLDVGQGDAIFIETPTKNQILIDGGPDRSVLKELGEVMPFWDRSINLVVLTHPNLDHVAGLVDVLKNYKVRMYLDAGDDYPLAEYEELKRIVSEKNIQYVRVKRGTKLALDEEVEFLVLSPENLVEGDPNFNSIIAKLSFGEVDFLLTGDAEKGEELRLVMNGDNIQSEVLKVGHHGSKTSSNPLFLEKVRPQYALISVGRKNRYGHPNSDVLKNLVSIGAQIFRTDVDSRLELKTDGKGLTVRTPK